MNPGMLHLQYAFISLFDSFPSALQFPHNDLTQGSINSNVGKKGLRFEDLPVPCILISTAKAAITCLFFRSSVTNRITFKSLVILFEIS